MPKAIRSDEGVIRVHDPSDWLEYMDATVDNSVFLYREAESFQYMSCSIVQSYKRIILKHLGNTRWKSNSFEK